MSYEHPQLQPLGDEVSATPSEIYAWLQEPTDSEIPVFTEIGSRRLDLIAQGRPFSDVQVALRGLSKDPRKIIQLLISGFEKSEIEDTVTQLQVQNAVKKLRSKMSRIEREEVDKIRKSLLDHAATADELRDLTPDEDWGDFIKCSPRDDRVLEISRNSPRVQDRARLLCNECIVRMHCLRDAIDTDQTGSVRGGLSDRERVKVKNLLYPKSEEAAAVNEKDEPAA